MRLDEIIHKIREKRPALLEANVKQLYLEGVASDGATGSHYIYLTVVLMKYANDLAANHARLLGVLQPHFVARLDIFIIPENAMESFSIPDEIDVMLP